MQPQPPPNAYQPGTKLTVGSHQVVVTKYISQGGYAHVYTCEISPEYNHTKVACLKRVAVPDKVALNILRAEVDAMKRLKGNRCIVSYIDSHASRMSTGVGYEVFVLMEYCARNGLIDLMNSRLVDKLSEPEVLKIMGEITEGVCNMHALDPPLIHRDIKIENVLINSEGDFKLCDFGSLSGILRPPRNLEEFKILQDDLMKHTTAQYRAPEMIDLYRGFPIDEKSDVWALGVFLYKVCYYTTPFENNHINGHAGGDLAILNAKFTFPSTPVYSSRLKNIISKLLVPDPRARPNAYQLLEEVCRMRNVPVPIENWYHTKKSRTATPQAPEEVKPSLPKRPGQLPPQKSSLLQHMNNIERSKTVSEDQRPITPIVSYSINKNSKSQPALNASLGNLISTQIRDLSQNSVEINKKAGFEKLDKPSVVRPNGASSRSSSGNRRPASMYVSDDYKTYLSSAGQMETLKQKITGPMETVEFEPNPNSHIDSNVLFLRNLSRQDSGRSLWKSQNTGDSISFGRQSRQNTGSRKTSEERRWKRNSITSLKSLLTGEKKDTGLRPPSLSRSKSKSRSPSVEISTNRSSESLNGFHSIYNSTSNGNSSSHSVYSHASKNSRKSSDSIKEDPEPESPSPPLPQRTKSIQSRVKMLLSLSKDPPPQKAANGYGKYTDGATSVPLQPVMSFKKPELKRSMTPQLQIYRTESKTSTASTHSTITPQSTFNKASTNSTPKVSSNGLLFSSLSPPMGKPKRKPPPPKPKKPKYLKSPPKKVIENSPNGGSKAYLVVDDGEKERRMSINSEVDLDDLERQFNERFPSAL